MFTLPKATYDEIVGWASRHPDIEVCGLLWRSEAGYTVRPLENVHVEPALYYRTSPIDVRQAYEEMDTHDGKPVAWYHSHPGGKPDPSETDSLGAFNVGMHYLIAYPQAIIGGDWEITEWRISAWECVSIGVLIQDEMAVEQ